MSFFKKDELPMSTPLARLGHSSGQRAAAMVAASTRAAHPNRAYFRDKPLEELTPDEMMEYVEHLNATKNYPPYFAMDMAAAAEPRAKRYSAKERLEARMNWGATGHPFHHLDIREAGDKHLIWVITKDFQSIVIEDATILYPSDTVVTQLRLLGGK